MTTLHDFYTYNDGRTCLHCGAPIHDQAHASTIFCPRIELPDGTIKSCKDDYHYLLNKEKNSAFQQLARFQKDIHHRIEKLLAENGDTVTAELLNQYGIRLDMPVRLTNNEKEKATFYFIDYCITAINNSSLKISTHENKF